MVEKEAPCPGGHVPPTASGGADSGAAPISAVAAVAAAAVAAERDGAQPPAPSSGRAADCDRCRFGSGRCGRCSVAPLPMRAELVACRYTFSSARLPSKQPSCSVRWRTRDEGEDGYTQNCLIFLPSANACAPSSTSRLAFSIRYKDTPPSSSLTLNLTREVGGSTGVLALQSLKE